MRLRSIAGALYIAALVTALTGAGGAFPAVAEEATPGAMDAAVGMPLAPDPARCTAEETPLEELEAIYDEVHGAGEDPTTSTPAAFVEPEGSPADAATVAAVSRVVIEVIRCNANGGSGLADAYYLTEEHLRESLAEMTPDDFAAYTASTPLLPEEWLMVYAVSDVRVLPDGRVAANPEIIVPGVGHFRDTLIFAQVDGRWLIDESHEGEPIYLAS